MKKSLLVAIMLGLGVILSLQTPALAWIEISNPMFTIVKAPGSDQVGQPTTTVVVAPSGSVTIGAFVQEGASQPIGYKGVGLSLAPLGLVDGYQLAFDEGFYSYDSAYYDEFYGVITHGGYLWDGAPVLGGYTWGGLSEGGMEGINDGYHTQATVMVTPDTDYYLNLVLRTSYDQQLPSWGMFSDVHVNVIPEPATMSLLGLGALGLFGLRRKKS